MDNNQLFGPIEVEGYGTIIVPGFTEEEKINYANQLFVNEGVFIPNKPCSSIFTLDEIIGVPFVAVGTLESYQCYSVGDLLEIIQLIRMGHSDKFLTIYRNLDFLIYFSKYIGNKDLENSLGELIPASKDYVNDIMHTLRHISRGDINVIIQCLRELGKITQKDLLAGNINPNSIRELVNIINSLVPSLGMIKRNDDIFFFTTETFSKISNDFLSGNLCINTFASDCNNLADAIESALFITKATQIKRSYF